MDFTVMSLLIAAAVICGVRIKRRPGMPLRADVCLWLTRAHLAVLALAATGIIIEWNSDFQLRWNIMRNSMLLAWLTGVAAFFVGIRTEKTRAVKLYLRIFPAFAILFLPIIFFTMSFYKTYYATSGHYTVCLEKGLLSSSYPYFHIRKTYWIVERPFATASNSVLEPEFYHDAHYFLTEDENTGALVFTVTNEQENGENCTILMTDTAKYRRNMRQTKALITDKFKRTSGFRNYYFEYTLPENGWKVELASNYENTVSSPENGENKIKRYSTSLDGSGKDTVVISYNIIDKKRHSNTIASMSIPKDSLPMLTPDNAVDEITSLFRKNKVKPSTYYLPPKSLQSIDLSAY